MIKGVGMDGATLSLGHATKLLTKVTEVSVVGSANFIAKKHLFTANIGCISNNFNKIIKPENNVPAANLVTHSLNNQSLDAHIFTKLSDKAEIYLAHLFELIERQPQGQSGPLLTDVNSNLAYIHGLRGWVVDLHWSRAYISWFIYARRLGSCRWRRGYQVISCN